MNFPEWAPEQLIDCYLKMIGDPFEGLGIDIQAFADKELIDEHREISRKASLEKGQDPEILYRLLTLDYMKSAWSQIKKTKAKNPLFSDYKEGALWDLVARAKCDFLSLETANKTPKQRESFLREITQHASSIINLLEETDKEINYANRKIVSLYLGSENIKSREAGREVIHSNFYDDITTAMNLDIHEAWDVIRKQENQEDNPDKPWDELTILERLRLWCVDAKETSLTDLLRFLVVLLDREAKRSPEIKKIGGTDPEKAFLIRRINEHMLWMYGQPFDTATAKIVSAILGLDSPLNRDDIRPYLASGKKIN